MTDTMRSVLTQGARRWLDGEISYDEFVQGLVLAIAESPDGLQKQEDLQWLAAKLASES
jgi:hypothetical protein